MRTNLIQSYLNGTPLVQQYNSDKAVKDFDVHRELSNRTFIKPLPSNGKLVKNTIFDMPSEMFKDIKYDANAFRHAIKGEANDHELGRLNDVGMKIGGVAIASYLFAKKQTPLTKIMEFIGLASFFGAMDIWPKLALQLPAYLIHGFNIRQKYEDSYGRKKLFYQDHQFIPWDLYSDKEINKIGDRLGIPKDIPNRREFIQEKMRKIALQNNTMWMLTAGFATPIMSGLICNALTNTVAHYQGEKLNKKADMLLANFSDELKKYDFSENQKLLDNLLTENAGKPVTEELLDKIHANLTDGLDYVTSTTVKEDLANMLPSSDAYNIDTETLDKVRNVLKENFASVQLSDKELEQILPDNNSIVEGFTQKGLLNPEVKDFSEHSKLIQNLMDQRIAKFIETNPDSLTAKKLKFAMKSLVHNEVGETNSILANLFKSKPAAVLSDEVVKSIKAASNVLNEFKAKNAVLDRFAYIKVAQAPETILANCWNDISGELLKTLKFTPEEIKQARIDREIVGDILRNKFESIVSNDETYSNVINELQKKLSELQSKMASLDTTKDDSGNIYHTLVNTTFGETADSLRQSRMPLTAERLVGFDNVTQSSLKELQLSFVTDRIKGVKSSFYRLLNTLDMYHRISKVENVNVLHPGMPRGVKEELVELCKQTLIDGHTSDYAVKFYSLRNPELNPHFDSEEARREYFSQIETKNGKVVNKYFGKAQPTEVVELSNDKNFFEAAMKLMYDGDLHPDTMAKIKDSVFFEDFMNYRSSVLKYLGGDKYFAKPNHLVNGVEVSSSSELKFLLMGCAPDEMFSKLCKQAYNSNVWFKTFGRLGAALLGVTVLSQFFMGRMKLPKVDKENK